MFNLEYFEKFEAEILDYLLINNKSMILGYYTHSLFMPGVNRSKEQGSPIPLTQS